MVEWSTVKPPGFPPVDWSPSVILEVGPSFLWAQAQESYQIYQIYQGSRNIEKTRHEEAGWRVANSPCWTHFVKCMTLPNLQKCSETIRNRQTLESRNVAIQGIGNEKTHTYHTFHGTEPFVPTSPRTLQCHWCWSVGELKRSAGFRANK